MRNLKKYPVTLDEIIKGLQTMSADFSKEGTCGDTRPLILDLAAKIVLRAGFAVSDVMQH